jgi:hypothetical protein
MFEVSNVKDGKYEFDISVVSNTIGGTETTRFAKCAFFDSSKTPIEYTIFDWKTISNRVEVLVCNFKLGELHNLLVLEERKLDLLAIILSDFKS